MCVRYGIIYLFLHLIDEVSLQNPDAISGVKGGSVILPCSYQEKPLKPKEMNVFWRFNETIKVYDIEGGNPLTEKQDAMFKGRIESFRSEYANGNFSLRLSNLTLSDTGQFSCYISNVKKENILTLKVRAPPPPPPTTTTPAATVSSPNPSVHARSSSMRIQPEGIVTFLIAVLEFRVQYTGVIG